MYLDLTFRCKIPIEDFPKLQVPIAEYANQVQADKMLRVDIMVPLEDGSLQPIQGFMVDAKEAHL